MTLALSWTPELRAFVSPRTAAEAAALPSPTPAAAWKRVITDLGKYSTTYQRGLPRAADAERALMQSVLAWRTAPAVATSDELAVAALMASEHALAWGAAALGLPTAIQAWLATANLQVEGSPYAKEAEAWIAPGSGARPSALNPEVLRAPLLLASPEVYAECRTLAARLWEEHPRHWPVLVQAFPREEAWSRALALAWLDDPAKFERGTTPKRLAASVTDLDLALAVFERAGVYDCPLIELVNGFGLSMLPKCLSVLAATTDDTQLKVVSRALSAFVSDEVARSFAAQLGRKGVRVAAVDYFARFPELGRMALAEVSGGKGRVAKLAAEILGSLPAAAAAPQTVPPIAKPPARAAPARNPDAEAPAELPGVLLAPPWESKRKARKPLVVTGVPVPSRPVRLSWPAALDELRGELQVRHAEPPVLDEAAQSANCERLGPQGDERLLDPLTRGCALRELLAVWPGFAACERGLDVEAAYGPALGDTLAEKLCDAKGHSWYIPWRLDQVFGAFYPGMAFKVAAQVEDPFYGALHLRLLEAHADLAASGLIPHAVGKNGAARKLAERVLRHLAGCGHASAVHAAAEPFGPSVVAALTEVLALDPILDCPEKPPKLGEGFERAALAPPRSKAGVPLPPEAVERIGAMLRFSGQNLPYAGLELVREACDESSLAELGWQLAAAWERNGSKGKDAWMAWGLRWLADTATTRRITPALKHEVFLRVLACLGTDAAVMELVTIAARGRQRGGPSSGRAEAATTKLRELALGRGVSDLDLFESLVPTGGGATELTLDFGQRSFRVVLDRQLQAWVEDAQGNRKQQFPRTTPTDDPERVSAARVVWDELREDVAAFGHLRILCLERTMVEGRTWSGAEFERRWLAHPLMKHIAQSIVWSVASPGAITTFRVAEDGSLSTATEVPFVIPPGARVGVPHPADWPDATLPAWQVLLSDYRIIQPFEQVNRRVAPPLLPHERGEVRRHYLGGLEPAEIVAALTARGWRRTESTLRWPIGKTSLVAQPIAKGEEVYYDLTLPKIADRAALEHAVNPLLRMLEAEPAIR